MSYVKIIEGPGAGDEPSGQTSAPQAPKNKALTYAIEGGILLLALLLDKVPV